jgi:4-hydroxythreonine-4-phosphate dehydrogenase
MKIHISQGHEKGIGLEILLKSFITAPLNIQSNILLHCEQNNLIENLQNLQIPYQFANNQVQINNTKLNCNFIKANKDEPISTLALLSAIKSCKNEDILVTLPTSKDQLILNNKKTKGHTDFLAKYFKRKTVMCFHSLKTHLLLITDHQELKTIPNISKDQIIEIINLVFINKNYKNIYFAGINPHAGESGLLGTEDICISEAISELSSKYPKQKFIGPLSGDTLHLYSENDDNLLVYMYHDQGLSFFKSKFGFIGINETIGLNFRRLSVDHGTAFDLYGKNVANPLGMSFLLNQISAP